MDTSGPGQTQHGRELRSLGWGGWAKILGIGLICSAVGSLWAQYAQLIHRTSHIAESVPPLSAVVALILLLALKPVSQFIRRRSPVAQNEILCIYAFVCLAVTIGFIGLYRQVLGLLTSLVYTEAFDTTVQYVKPYLPGWLIPTDPEVVRQLWEGSEGEGVPWAEWLVPLACLGAIFVIFYFTCTCMIGFFHQRWSRDERLRYPVAEVALEMVGSPTKSGFSCLAGNHWFWVGALLAIVFNLVYIIPAIGNWTIPRVQFDFNELGMKPPWDAGRPGPYFRFNPIVFGLGFLVSVDVLLSIWVFVIVMKLEAVLIAYFGVPSGWGGPLFLMSRQEGMGAYVALVLIMIWAGRRYFAAALKDCVGLGSLQAGAPGRGTVAGFLIGVGLMLFIFSKCGMVMWFAVLFLAVLLVRVLAMARVRAQAGIPNIYLHVFEVRSMMWLLGGATLASAGESTVAGLVFMAFLFNCTYITPYLADGFRISEVTGFGYRRWILLSTLAVVTGFVLASVSHLTAIYDHGFGMLGQRPSSWPANYVVAGATQGTPAEPMRLAIAAGGFLTTMLLAVFQRAYYWFPFSPVGFVVACAIGDYVCGPAFMAWALKKAVLKYGGGPAYRAARAVCIGLVFTHLAAAAIWGILGAFDFEPTRRYAIGFW